MVIAKFEIPLVVYGDINTQNFLALVYASGTAVQSDTWYRYDSSGNYAGQSAVYSVFVSDATSLLNAYSTYKNTLSISDAIGYSQSIDQMV